MSDKQIGTLPGYSLSDQTRRVQWTDVVRAVQSLKQRDGAGFPAAFDIAAALRGEGFQVKEGFRLGPSRPDFETSDGNVRADLMVGNLCVLLAPAASVPDLRAWCEIAAGNPYVADTLVITRQKRQVNARGVLARIVAW